MDDSCELEVLGKVLDIVEGLKTREQRIAALRCFVRGTHGMRPLAGDEEIMEMKF